ncbi:hypothetical protein [Solimonas sp. SE-A11]|uniref:TRAFAC clade GTPase domain-containing protein n=1 Tax=Solimonas sp. SE-A11 TaxID=3054954 RepID=UPI00259CFB25|nr:hypothetical protein [Solimonas sp. SE-A11]
MSDSDNSILLIGESGAGKTHFGAQLLKRLLQAEGALRMDGAATNLEPFQAAMQRLDEGMAADHTATATYVDSVWPITDAQGRRAQLIWPDYGGEQIKTISTSRRVPVAWRERVLPAQSWLLLIRLQHTRVSDDIFSRPLQQLGGGGTAQRAAALSDQSRLIELLQMMIYIGAPAVSEQMIRPRLTVLLTCWDELKTEELPGSILQQQLPMLTDFIKSTWASPEVLGLSALERPLHPRDQDPEYAARGPEQFGYVVLPDGQRSTDLTLPIQRLLIDLA